MDIKNGHFDPVHCEVVNAPVHDVCLVVYCLNTYDVMQTRVFFNRTITDSQSMTDRGTDRQTERETDLATKSLVDGVTQRSDW